MHIYKMTLALLLVAIGWLSAGDQAQDELPLAEEPVLVKLDILDSIHGFRSWYDRYVEPTLSLRDLIEREYAIYANRHDSLEVVYKSCELALDNDYYRDRYSKTYDPNDSVKNNPMIYLQYGLKK